MFSEVCKFLTNENLCSIQKTKPQHCKDWICGVYWIMGFSMARRKIDINNWPNYLEIWIADKINGKWLALVQDYRRNFEEGELYEVEIVGVD